MSSKTLTLVFLCTDEHVCLGFKKRGFGEGLWNGYGGKLEEGETVEVAACREVNEESGCLITPEALETVATLQFHYPDQSLTVHAFVARRWEGEPAETEEMLPQWFLHHEIPYDTMWEDDQHWLPRVLSGEQVSGEVWFQADGRSIERMRWD